VQGNGEKQLVSRRSLLGIASIGFIGLISKTAEAQDLVGWGQMSLGWARPRLVLSRSLSLRHRHTDETLDVVYYENGRYIGGALKEISYLLRDFRNDEVKPIDRQLLDLLYALRLKLETKRPFEVYSAYRSPQTNAMLRREGVGVARNSMHMYGKAIDISVPGVDNRYLARAAWTMQRGGVGSYRRSSFVHVDVGEVRSWYS
jgi:uncharacterized protein YcbK (DUF882 family)